MRVAKVFDSLNTLRKMPIEFGDVIDVGIQHSTPVLIEIFPDLHHHLFEPVEEYYPHIRKNYAGISHHLVEAAVADFDGTLPLKTEKKTRGDEVSHSYIATKETTGTRQVRALQLDSYFPNKVPEKPFFLKIDVEGPGVPLQILTGARRVLQHTAVVMIEMTVDRFMERARFLDDMGFDVWDICDLCYYGDCLWQVDVIFVRRDLKEHHLNLRPMHRRPFQSNLWQSGF